MKCPRCRGYAYIEYDTMYKIYYKTCINCGFKDYDVSKSDYIKEKFETLIVRKELINGTCTSS